MSATGEIWSVIVPVQLGFTVYVPFIVTETMLPFWLTVAVAVVPPIPSKVCVPTLANGPANAGGARIDPVVVYAKVPVSEASEHPLSAACAPGTTLNPSAIATAIAQFFVVMFFKIFSLRRAIFELATLGEWTKS